MLVYDITNEKSFENIRNWIRNIEEVSIGTVGYYISAGLDWLEACFIPRLRPLPNL